MADDLSTVASLLKDTNKKLDKLHSDNEQNDTKGDIIKGALPEILSDTINTQRNIGTINARQKEEKDRDIRQMNADEKAADNQLKILGEIKTPMIDLGEIKTPMIELGQAMPRLLLSGPGKASDISAEKALPSDFKLMLQALTPKALTQGFKVGLGDMFKELGGGIKNIGRGIKSLGSKGLTAAQRKSEEKEKESKDNKKDSFFKKQLGSTVKLLGGILKTAKLAGSAGFLALLGAGAIFALAKLIESPYWNTVAGILESGFKKIRSLFEYMDDQFGVGGIIATALALYFGPKAALTLAGKGIKALAKKLFFKGAANTLAGSAGQATGALTGKGGLLSALGRIGGAVGLIVAAGYAVYKLGELGHNRQNKSYNTSVDKSIESVMKPDATQKQLEKAQRALSEIRNSVATKGKDSGGLNEKLLDKIDEEDKKLAKRLQKMEEKKPSPVEGLKPSDLMKLTKGDFQKALLSKLQATIFKGNKAERSKQFAGVGDSVFSKFFGTENFKKLNLAQQKELLQRFATQEQKQLFGRSRSRLRAGVGLGKTDQGLLSRSLQSGEGYAEMARKRNAQIKDPTIIKLNDELRDNTEQLKILNDAKNGDKGDVSVVTANSRGGDRYEYTMPPAVPLKLSSGNGQNTVYDSHF